MDGQSGREFNNVEIRPNDSIYVFVDACLEVQNSALPLTVEETIEFETNGKIQEVVITADGQDVDRLHGCLLYTSYHERLMAYVSPDEPIYEGIYLQTDTLPVESVWVLREGYCPNRGVFPFCNRRAGRQAIYEAGSVETLIKIVDENGGYAIIPELHVPLLSSSQQANVRALTNPEPTREIAFVVHRNFVRERLLNILADAIKTVIPRAMINNRLKKFPITL